MIHHAPQGHGGGAGDDRAVTHTQLTLSLVSLTVSPGQTHTAAMGSVPTRVILLTLDLENIRGNTGHKAPQSVVIHEPHGSETTRMSVDHYLMSPAGGGHLGSQPLSRQRPHSSEVTPAQWTQASVGVTRVAGQMTIVTLKWRVGYL